jgi:ferritin-like metal-binding protein YciE
MAKLDSLKDLYAEEVKDLWSANDQMAKVVKTMATKAHDEKLKKALTKSLEGINQHTATIKALLQKSDSHASSEHCKGMEGLVKEATKHIGAEAPKSSDLLDIEIIAQYQRMSHYGMAGFGSAASYAKALGMKDDYEKLTKIVKDIYGGDEYASDLAVRAEKEAASKRSAAAA